MNRVQLDQQRADFLDALYQNSGRSCGTYTGLWQEFGRGLASNLRDMDTDKLLADCVRAIGGTESHLAERHALACMKVMRASLLEGWE